MKKNLIIFLLALGATAAGPPAQDSNPVVKREVKTIEVIASQYRFDPEAVSVTQGDTVRLRLRSTDRDHAFAIKAFRVKTMIPKGGETVVVEFVADKAGTFKFTCAEYCGVGHSSMTGRIVVVAREK